MAMAWETVVEGPEPRAAWPAPVLRPVPAGPPSPPTEPPPTEPPPVWPERWAGHDQRLELAGVSADAVVYVDGDVPPAAGRRLLPYVEEVWRYARLTYGDLGPDPRLYAVVHGGDRHRGGHRLTWRDGAAGARNVADCGDGVWRSDDATMLDLINLQAGRVVEAVNHGTTACPALGIWGDGPWAEIFRYDFHVALGRGPHAARLAERQWTHRDRAGTYWFRDWFHPLWQDAGGTRVLVRFFDLLAGQFPRDLDGSYRRMLTWGEFLHFSSGAARGDVTPLARRAFGWRPSWDAQLERARDDFPLVAY